MAGTQSSLPSPTEPTPAARRRLLGRVRADAFAGLGEATAPRLGLEVEVLPVAADGAVLGPIAGAEHVEGAAHIEGAEGSSVEVVRGCARALGWIERAGPHGLPSWRTADGGHITFEPGGQVELASPVCPDLTTLAASVRDTLDALGVAFDRAGVRLLARGLDPVTPLSATRRFLAGERYRRQEAHYDRRGEAGRRMMRQSLALHVNVDVPSAGIDAWWAANALTPTLTALFANSPRCDGRETGWRSARSALWRALDPSRTGVFGIEPTALPAARTREAAVRRYAHFAARAEVFAFGPLADPPITLERALATGPVSEADLSNHFTTLFPEVRPRGYLELRSIDALPLRWVLMPVACVVGLLFDTAARTHLSRDVAPADVARLERAGRSGVRDPEVRREARRLVERAIEGLDRDSLGIAGRHWAAELDAFADATLRRGLDPGAIAGDELV